MCCALSVSHAYVHMYRRRSIHNIQQSQKLKQKFLNTLHGVYRLNLPTLCDQKSHTLNREFVARQNVISENPDRSSYSLHGFRVTSITHEANRKFITMNSSRRKILTCTTDTQEILIVKISRDAKIYQIETQQI